MLLLVHMNSDSSFGHAEIEEESSKISIRTDTKFGRTLSMSNWQQLSMNKGGKWKMK